MGAKTQCSRLGEIREGGGSMGGEAPTGWYRLARRLLQRGDVHILKIRAGDQAGVAISGCSYPVVVDDGVDYKFLVLLEGKLV